MRVAFNFLVLTIGFIAGFMTRSAVQLSRTYTFHDVRVVRRDPPDSYLMMTEFKQEFEVKFCTDYVPDLDAGSKLIVLVYEDQESCKSVSDKHTGFIVERGEDGKPLLAKF